ncbi:glycerate kinase [Mycolicibacterium frederiksbergense]|uniref:glycerate kinase n=1 Tax=Mycolicibacterium frederiksbergense TaxID=117567 RepID=UPI00399C06EF
MSRHIVVAPDKFKGSLTAAEAAAAISRGLRQSNPKLTVSECPIADGGEGTLAAAVAAGYECVTVSAPGPTGSPVPTAYARRGRSAVVEMADISGLLRLDGGVHAPMTATSRGLGVVVGKALDDGCRHIIVGIGGSACTDGGAGFLQGLGAHLEDGQGQPLPDGGGALRQAAALNVAELHPGLKDATLVIAGDVDNPLCGPSGAAVVYAPQKGASAEQVVELDRALEHWSNIVAATIGRDLRDATGAGAAGGVGFAAMAVLGATMRTGIDVVLELVGIDDHLRGASAVITGEGCLDSQSLRGKAPLGIRLRASEHAVPAFAIVGTNTLTPEETAASQFTAVYSLSDREPDVRKAMTRATDLLGSAAADLASRFFVPANRC